MFFAGCMIEIQSNYSTVEVQSSCILVYCHISILRFMCTSRLYWDVLDYNLSYPTPVSVQNWFFHVAYINTCAKKGSEIFGRILMNE